MEFKMERMSVNGLATIYNSQQLTKFSRQSMKCIFSIVLLSFAFLFVKAGWQHKTEFDVNYSNGDTLTNYQVMLTLTTSNFDFSKLAHTDGRDIRFSKNSTGYSVINFPYWIESWTIDSDSTSIIWIKIDSIPDGGTKLYMFYGDNSATAASDGNATFEFFDDFESNAPAKAFGYNTNTLDPDAYPGWTVVSGSWVVEDGILKNYYGPDKITIDSPFNEPAGRAIRCKVRETGDWKYPMMVLGYQDQDNYYQMIFDQAGNKVKLGKVVNGNGTKLDQSSTSLSKSTWYRWELKWESSSKLDGEIWNSSYNSLSTLSETSNLQSWNTGDYGLRGYRGVSKCQFDDILVRKYSSPEPTTSVSNSSPLAIELISFTASPRQDNISLHWKTAAEINNLGFTVFRSKALNEKFIQLGFIEGAGNSILPKQYTFIDNDIKKGETYYYYLEDVDFKGEKNASRIIEVTVPVNTTEKAIELLPNFPNPIHSNSGTWIPFKLQSEQRIKITITAITGRIIKEMEWENKPAGNYDTKSTAAFWNGRDREGKPVPKGIYFYTLENGGQYRESRYLVVK